MKSCLCTPFDEQSSLMPPWEGIYSHFRDVPRHGEGFNSPYWVEHSRQRTQETMERVASNSLHKIEVSGQSAFLGLLVSSAASANQGVRILDFGGGMGVGYLHLTRVLTTSNSVDYTVVETAPICRAARELFRDEPSIRFVSELPSQSNFDIVYLNSSLQYVEDYQRLLGQLSHYKPSYFLFVRLSAGDVTTYATAQLNVRGSRIPYWFVNIGDILSVMRSLGYSLAFKSLGEEEFDQTNFPSIYRLGRPCNLMFRPLTSVAEDRKGNSRCQ